MLCELLGNFAWDILCTSANPLKEQVLRPESVMGSNFRCIPPITHTSVVKHRVTFLRLSSVSVFLQNDRKTRQPVENAARLGDHLVLGLLLLPVLPKHLHDGDSDDVHGEHDNDNNDHDDSDDDHHAPLRSPAHLHQGRRSPQAASFSGSCR